MDFYTRYRAWNKAINGLVETLQFLETQADWSHIIGRQMEIQEWIDIAEKYHFWAEFEQFILSTDINKVDGFLKTVETRFDYWLSAWARLFRFETPKDFKEWFYPFVYQEFKADSTIANQVYEQLNLVNYLLDNFLYIFEQIKSLYTKLPPRNQRPFYERIKNSLIVADTGSPYCKYTFADWLGGNMDEVLVRFYLQTGEDIKPLIWSDKWLSFNTWIETNCDYKFGAYGFSNHIDDITSLIIDRVVHNEGNLHLLLRHQTDLYSVTELHRIFAELPKIHNQIVTDNWHHYQKGIDLAIQYSVNVSQLINDTIILIDDYLAGKTVTLIYPLYNPLYVSQSAIVDAYQALLRGHVETEFVRPLRKIQPIEGLEEDFKEHKPQHLTRSPYVEAELLIKSKEYLRTQLSQKTASPPISKLLFINSYKWLDNDADLEIPRLFEQLIQHTYVIKTTLKDFKAVFTGQPIGTFLPIHWASNNASELIYFTNKCLGSLVEEEGKRRNWQRLRGCFVKADGSQFSEDLRNLNQKLETDFGQQRICQLISYS